MVRLLIILSISMITVGCRPAKVIRHRTVKDTTVIREIPRNLQIPGAEIRTQALNIDSLAALLHAGIKAETISKTTVKYDPETNLRVGLLIDELGNLTAVCEKQEHIIEILEREITRIREEKEYASEIKERSFLEELKVAAVGAVLSLIAVMAVSFFQRHKN